MSRKYIHVSSMSMQKEGRHQSQAAEADGDRAAEESVMGSKGKAGGPNSCREERGLY